MMERIKRFLRKGNLVYMFISLVMAFLLWLAVTKPPFFPF